MFIEKNERTEEGMKYRRRLPNGELFRKAA
jgi:hypothetical protein